MINTLRALGALDSRHKKHRLRGVQQVTKGKNHYELRVLDIRNTYEGGATHNKPQKMLRAWISRHKKHRGGGVCNM
jgi:hypothetical protein